MRTHCHHSFLHLTSTIYHRALQREDELNVKQRESERPVPEVTTGCCKEDFLEEVVLELGVS